MQIAHRSNFGKRVEGTTKMTLNEKSRPVIAYYNINIANKMDFNALISEIDDRLSV